MKLQGTVGTLPLQKPTACGLSTQLTKEQERLPLMVPPKEPASST